MFFYTYYNYDYSIIFSFLCRAQVLIYFSLLMFASKVKLDENNVTSFYKIKHFFSL